MESIEPFIHLRELGVIICDECYKTVIPNRIAPHLRSKHEIGGEEIKRIVTQINRLDDLIRDRKDVLERAVKRAGGTTAIPHLPIHQGGFACNLNQDGEISSGNGCGYIVRTIERIKAHCRKEHNWENTQSKGGSLAYRRASHQAPRLWRSVKYYQRFFTQGAGQEYFEVRVKCPAADVRQEENSESVAR
jgi:hypothetical protein